MHTLKIHPLEEKNLCVRDFSYIQVFLLSFTLQCLSLAFDFHGNELLWGCLKNVMLPKDLVMQLVNVVCKLTWRHWCWALSGSVQRQVSQAGGVPVVWQRIPLVFRSPVCMCFAQLKFPIIQKHVGCFPPSFLVLKKLGLLSEPSHVSLAGHVDTFRNNSCTKTATITVLGLDRWFIWTNWLLRALVCPFVSIFE